MRDDSAFDAFARAFATHLYRTALLLTGDREAPHRADLVNALRTVPRQRRAALVPRYWIGLNEAETAAALGSSPGSAKPHTARGPARPRAAVASGEETP